jgi:hypothetical protein
LTLSALRIGEDHCKGITCSILRRQHLPFRRSQVDTSKMDAVLLQIGLDFAAKPASLSQEVYNLAFMKP